MDVQPISTQELHKRKKEMSKISNDVTDKSRNLNMQIDF